MLKITKNDYVEMEVQTLTGEWVKKDVLKTLEGGGAIYLEGSKHSDGTYSMGMVVPAKAYKSLPTVIKKVKSLKDIVIILVDSGYKPDDDGDWMKYGSCYNFTADMFEYCGEEPSIHYNWEEEWLEDVTVSPEPVQYGSDTPESPIFS